MTGETVEAHWDRIYADRVPTELSWYQPEPVVSLAMIHDSGIDHDAAIVDVGGGASTLVDALLARGYSRLTVLDIAASGMAAARRRLGADVSKVEWLVQDVRTWRPEPRFDLWHDRAVLHFLTEPTDQRAYVAALRAALPSGGQVIVAAFALDGPERCSGLPVRRYDEALFAATLGPDFRLLDSTRENHHTPGGVVQRFVYARFRRE